MRNSLTASFSYQVRSARAAASTMGLLFRRYDQDQFQTNADININRRHRLSARYLNSASERKEEFFQSNLPGFTSTIPAGHQNAVLSHAYAMGGEAANEIRAGYVLFTGANSAAAPI